MLLQAMGSVKKPVICCYGNSVCLLSLEQLWFGISWDMSWLCLFCRLLSKSVFACFDGILLICWQKKPDRIRQMIEDEGRGGGFVEACLLFKEAFCLFYVIFSVSQWDSVLLHVSLVGNEGATGETMLTKQINRHLWSLCLLTQAQSVNMQKATDKQ